MSDSSKYDLRALVKEDWESVSSIYKLGIETGIATLETDVPSWDSWDQSHLKHSRWVISDRSQIRGWIALSPVSDRCVYGGVAEVSVYVDPAFSGRGLGSRLITAAIESSENQGIWTLNAALFRDNIGSQKLHEKCGFRQIGYREKIGKLRGRWMDTLLYERRSQKIF